MASPLAVNGSGAFGGGHSVPPEGSRRSVDFPRLPRPIVDAPVLFCERKGNQELESGEV